MGEKIKQQLQKFNHSFSEADFEEFALQLKGRSGRDIDQITNELKDIEMALLEKAEYYLPVEQGNGRTLYRPLKGKIDGARKMTFKEDVNRYSDIAPLTVTREMVSNVILCIKSSVKAETEAERIKLERLY